MKKKSRGYNSTSKGDRVNRDSSSGRFVDTVLVSRGRGHGVTVSVNGHRATADSYGKAAIAAKGRERYSTNIETFRKNDSNETDSAISIRSKDKKDLQKKYADIESKRR